MLEGIIEGLIVAFILSLFNVDEIVADAFKELFKMEITTSGYYFIFAILGLISGIFNR